MIEMGDRYDIMRRSNEFLASICVNLDRKIKVRLLFTLYITSIVSREIVTFKA